MYIGTYTLFVLKDFQYTLGGYWSAQRQRGKERHIFEQNHITPCIAAVPGIPKV